MAQQFTRNGSPVLRITPLDGEDGIIELIPRPGGEHTGTTALNEDGKALAEFLAARLPRDTIHALRAFLE